MKASNWVSRNGTTAYALDIQGAVPCLIHACILVHPQNVRFQNVRFKNVRFQNVWFQNVWNVRFTKRQVYKMSGLQNVRSSKRLVAKNIHIHSVLVVGGNTQVLLQPCLQAKWWLCFILYFRGFFPYITIISNNDTLITLNRNANLAIPILFVE